jgi:thiol:disulfide interchange protein DsbC
MLYSVNLFSILTKGLTMKLPAFILTALIAPVLMAAPQEDIKASLAIISPNLKVEEVSETGIPGVYQIVAGPTILYSDATGKYFFEGPMYHLEANKDFTNLTAKRQAVLVKKTLDGVDPASEIIFKAPEEKTYITVFTDVDCTYCRALHKEVGELNAAGVTVRYMAFPRVPAGQPSFIKSQSIWCATDRNAALTAAKQGTDPAAATCKDPVLTHQEIGKSLQFSATPVIVFKNGTVMPGYVPAKELIPMAEKEST